MIFHDLCILHINVYKFFYELLRIRWIVKNCIVQMWELSELVIINMIHTNVANDMIRF